MDIMISNLYLTRIYRFNVLATNGGALPAVCAFLWRF